MERLKDRTRQRRRISMPRNSIQAPLRFLLLASVVLLFSGCPGDNRSTHLYALAFT